MFYICPVCGYDRMLRPPAAGYICSCCGTEFELDDDEKSHKQLRAEWIASGFCWWSPALAPPAGWDAIEQLKRAGHIHDLYGFSGEARSVSVYFVGIPRVRYA